MCGEYCKTRGRRRVTDLDDLKYRVRTEWTKLDHAVTATAVRQWRRRLLVSVKAGDGHFDCFYFRHCVCTLTGRFGSIAVVNDSVLCNRPTWRLFNAQGKVATLLR